MTATTPLRGRNLEQRRLEALVGAARDGAGGVVVIEGAAGIGKTRLLAEGRASAERLGLLVAHGGGEELDQVTPWGALVKTLSSGTPPLMHPGQLDSLRGLSDHRLAALEIMRAALEQASSHRPLLIALDDLQWADPSTLLALGSLPLLSYPIAWLLARRPLPNSPQLDAVISRLVEAGSDRLHLGPLDHTDAVDLAHDLTPESPGADLDTFISAAGGNPFYIIEMLKVQLDGREHAQHQRVLSTDLRAAVTRSLRSHSERCRDLLRIASVLGREFTAAELVAMTGEPVSQWLGALEEALAAEVLVEFSDRLAFRHDLLRQAVYDEVPESTRVALHRDAAEALRSTGAPTIRIAGQLAMGASAGDDDAIIPLNAAVDELIPTSPGAAADFQLRSLELLRDEDDRRADMVMRAVNALSLAGRREEAFDIGGRFLREFRPSAPVEAALQLALSEAWVFEHMRGYPSALPDRLIHNPGVDPAVLKTALACERADQMWDGHGKEAEELFRHALQAAMESRRPLELATAAYLLVLNSTLRGRMTDVLHYAKTALLAAASLEGPQSSGIFEMLYSFALAANGRLTEALSTLHDALKLTEAAGRTYFVIQGRWLRAFYLLAQGNVEEARSEARAEVIAAEQLGFAVHSSRGLTVLAESAIRQGDIAEMRTTLRRFQVVSEPRALPDGPWAMALAADSRRDAGGVFKGIGPILSQLNVGCFGVSITQHHRLPALARMALGVGDRVAAEAFTEAADTLAKQNPHIDSLAAGAAHARGLLESDAALLREAVDCSARSEARLVEAGAREDLGATLARSRSDKALAIEQLDAAYSIYTASKAHRDAARVRAALRSFGVRKRQTRVARPREGWESLTKSELAIVRLVTQGMTNREVATDLFLSPETVNTHLRHAFLKLGIRSRVMLVRIAADRGEM